MRVLPFISFRSRFVAVRILFGYFTALKCHLRRCLCYALFRNNKGGIRAPISYRIRKNTLRQMPSAIDTIHISYIFMFGYILKAKKLYTYNLWTVKSQYRHDVYILCNVVSFFLSLIVKINIFLLFFSALFCRLHECCSHHKRYYIFLEV